MFAMGKLLTGEDYWKVYRQSYLGGRQFVDDIYASLLNLLKSRQESFLHNLTKKAAGVM